MVQNPTAAVATSAERWAKISQMLLIQQVNKYFVCADVCTLLLKQDGDDHQREVW